MSHEGGNPFGERPREQQRPRPLTKEEERIIERLTSERKAQFPETDLTSEFINHPEFQQALGQAAYQAFGDHDFRTFEEIIKRFHFQSWLKSPEGQKEAQSFIEQNLPYGHVEDVLWVIEYFDLPKQLVGQLVKQSLIESFDKADFYLDSIRIAERFPFDVAFLQGDDIAPRVKKSSSRNCDSRIIPRICKSSFKHFTSQKP